MNNEIRGAVGYGVATHAGDGTVLDASFPVIRTGQPVAASGTAVIPPDEAARHLGPMAGAATGTDPARDVAMLPVRTRIADLAAPPVDRHDLFLRLHLLSTRRAEPGTVHAGSLDMFLPVAWTSAGPCLPERAGEARWMARAAGRSFEVDSIYHVPRMTDYVIPTAVRIMNGANVRLGAFLSPGTMVTAAGFCNAFAGTLGPAMIEGRISRGVLVGGGCHVGGGSSLMGAVSGGGSQLVSLGRNCLIGANAGVGIALGDGCVVEAGCYITAGAPIRVAGAVRKAVELSGRSGLLFRRNALSGALEALPAPSWPGLNPALHHLD